jgi:hypothetical protein
MGGLWGKLGFFDCFKHQINLNCIHVSNKRLLAASSGYLCSYGHIFYQKGETHLRDGVIFKTQLPIKSLAIPFSLIVSDHLTPTKLQFKFDAQ